MSKSNGKTSGGKAADRQSSKQKQAPPAAGYPASPHMVGLDWIDMPVAQPRSTADLWLELGFKARTTVGRYPRLALGGLVVRLVPGHHPADSAVSPPITFHVAVDDIEAKRAHVLEMGMSPEPIRANRRGDRSFKVIDPDGYAFHFSGPDRRA